MRVVAALPELREILAGWRGAGESIALVPTMGNLHAGHLSLVREAKIRATRVVVSIFVNPTQFGQGEDFDRYPRTPEEDAEQLRAVGTDLLFAPSVAVMYPAGPALGTFVEVPGLSADLCGRSRPGHFRGVTTVVCKLLNLVQPHLAIFGEKDYQQLVLIRRMVADLNIPVAILAGATQREGSGLALSSRNRYLSAAEKAKAPQFQRRLSEAAQSIENGNCDYAALERRTEEALRADGFRPDYVCVRRSIDLSSPTAGDRDLIVLAAVWLGATRLIDNRKITCPAAAGTGRTDI